MKKKVSEDKLVLAVPKEIRKLAQGFRKQRVEKEQAEKRAKQKMDAENQRIRAARLKTGLKYATKIFFWAEALKKIDLGQELMKKSHPPTAYKSIIFFDDHIIGVDWIGLGISPDGLFLTHGGRGAFLSRRQMSSPKELAESVHTVILQLASE